MPKLTKARMVEGIAGGSDLNQNQASKAVEQLLEIIKSTLESGEDVLISGFGKFCVRKKGERLGRNPATRKRMMLPARKVVTFKCSRNLRDRVNKR